MRVLARGVAWGWLTGFMQCNAGFFIHAWQQNVCGLLRRDFGNNPTNQLFCLCVGFDQGAFILPDECHKSILNQHLFHALELFELFDWPLCSAAKGVRATQNSRVPHVG